MMLQAKLLPTPQKQGASAQRITGCCCQEGKTLLCLTAAAFPMHIPSAFAYVYPFSAGLPYLSHLAPNPTTLQTHHGKPWLPGAVTLYS